MTKNEKNHVIEATEPVWVTAEHYWDNEDERVVKGEREIGPSVSGLLQDSEYVCRCGEEFDSWEDARIHLETGGEVF